MATNEWKYHAEVVTNLDDSLPMVPCNIGEINQVVLNLVVNGAHAIRDRFESKEKGEIGITSKHYPSDDCVVISITDNGGGIPPKVQERIFEPFFRFYISKKLSQNSIAILVDLPRIMFPR